MSRTTRLGIWLMLTVIIISLAYLAARLQFGDSERIVVIFTILFGGMLMLLADE